MDQLTSKQISEWEAYDRIDPIGEWRNDFRIAKLESLITNIVQQLYATKGSKPTITTPMDFMVDWSGDKVQEVKKQSVEEMKAVMMGIASSQNKKPKMRNTPPVKRTNRREK